MTSSGAGLSRNDSYVMLDCASSSLTIYLPSGLTSHILHIKKIDQTTNTATLVAASGDTIDGASTLVLRVPYEAVTLVLSDGDWSIF